MFVSDDKEEIAVFYFKVLAEIHEPIMIKLKGLNPDFDYVDKNGEIYSGDELMYMGIEIPKLEGDFRSVIWHFLCKTKY